MVEKGAAGRKEEVVTRERIRVSIARKRNDDEDAKEELYSLVTVVEIPKEELKGLGTKSVFRLCN
ncbi:hypothetical protein TSUD_313040 [Trifolium subterraneum]|uniref:Uncharacterized protein n=1 Tax=Trifolium subterraneum TaxID=3900 RepID=A0A2Z6MWP9_TRISU|nr:hypothetical protein TSUD_313040 [Trifolium subterraneum]